MVQKEMPQAWWFDSHNLARPSPWLNNTLSELDDKTKQMLKLIDQDADSFAQRAEMYYKKRPVLVDMLGDLYRTHRSLAGQYDLLKHGSGTRQTVFGPSSCTQSLYQAPPNGKPTSRSSSSCSVSSYDSESEVDDPEQEEHEEEVPEAKTESSQGQQEQVELMRAEIKRLKEQNAELQKVAEENAVLKAELAEKDEEKREVIRQLASSFDMMREANSTLRECIKGSKNYSPSSRALDLKKLTKDLFSARLFTHCKPTGPIVAL
ncbi:protein NETWORKED 3C-like [Phragmites australis]|uniref:protein NETWORKED 3C-like n=1 Tax=Phragmites australis TaxID=29695 RepID=UPI002D799D22|nr:protein NETWORKED 3C-like [Phragmites australis]XP_062190569.1 protein NETWORKED 3C-like [Phragmites australis]XP_062190570.1 protein NETWORKED 3C-like [Phragmites australis]XP_062190571.1 protein NETWORKED 3C-like [Phragmites australis]